MAILDHADPDKYENMDKDNPALSLAVRQLHSTVL